MKSDARYLRWSVCCLLVACALACDENTPPQPRPIDAVPTQVDASADTGDGSAVDARAPLADAASTSDAGRGGDAGAPRSTDDAGQN